MSDNKPRMNLDEFLNDFWPPTSALAGLVFETDADYSHARALLGKKLGTFQLGNPEQRYLVVRKIDPARIAAAGLIFAPEQRYLVVRKQARIAAAGLIFEEIELIDLDSVPPAERYQHDLKMIKSEAVQRRMAEMLRRPG